MLNVIKVKVIFVIIVGALVGVEVVLELCLQVAVGGLGSPDVGLLGNIGAGPYRPHKAVAHRHHRGNAGLQREHQQDTEQGDQHPYGMPFDKGHRPGRQLFRGDCRFFGGPCPGLGGLPCLFRILALDAPLLQMPGEGAALHFRVLLHGRAVMVIRRGLDMLCLGFSDGLLRMLPDGLFCVA